MAEILEVVRLARFSATAMGPNQSNLRPTFVSVRLGPPVGFHDIRYSIKFGKPNQ